MFAVITRCESPSVPVDDCAPEELDAVAFIVPESIRVPNCMVSRWTVYSPQQINYKHHVDMGIAFIVLPKIRNMCNCHYPLFPRHLSKKFLFRAERHAIRTGIQRQSSRCGDRDRTDLLPGLVLRRPRETRTQDPFRHLAAGVRRSSVSAALVWGSGRHRGVTLHSRKVCHVF